MKNIKSTGNFKLHKSYNTDDLKIILSGDFGFYKVGDSFGGMMMCEKGQEQFIKGVITKIEGKNITIELEK